MLNNPLKLDTSTIKITANLINPENITPDLEDRQLISLALDYVNKIIFTSFDIEVENRLEMLSKVFVALNFIDWKKVNLSQFNNVGMLYERYDQGCKLLSMSGYPIFYSCKFLHKKYVNKFEELIKFINENNSDNKKQPSRDITYLCQQYLDNKIN